MNVLKDEKSTVIKALSPCYYIIVAFVAAENKDLTPSPAISSYTSSYKFKESTLLSPIDFL